MFSVKEEMSRSEFHMMRSYSLLKAAEGKHSFFHQLFKMGLVT